MFGQKTPKDILITLEVDSTTISPFDIKFTLTNNYSKSQKICTYSTPLEGFYGNMFMVKNEIDETIGYKGIMKKRSKPGKSDYIEIEARKSVSVTFNISDYYDVIKKSTYFIQFLGNEYLNKLPSSNTLKIIID